MLEALTSVSVPADIQVNKNTYSFRKYLKPSVAALYFLLAGCSFSFVDKALLIGNCHLFALLNLFAGPGAFVSDLCPNYVHQDSKLHFKSVNLQYNRLVCWDAGT